tara:strand:+ start:2379 stop:3209 length:831 start_codon:yes stop_codon:yes gene_type:complete
MSEETEKDNTPEEEVAAEAAAPEEAKAAEVEETPAEAAPAEEPAEKVEAAATEEPAEKVEAATEAPAEKEKAVEVEASAEAPAATEAKTEEDPKTDKLKKAEEILRSSAPAAPREEMDNAYEKVVHINRCAKVVKGGRRFSFSALVVTGDREGQVGVGFGKAQEVAECIKKASEASKRQMVSVNITHNTIPHPVIGVHGGGRVLLRPASPGTGLIAGGGVRAVVEAAGIRDVLAKSMGSNNHANVIKATINALEKLRTKEQIYTLRGKRIAEKKAI